MKKKPVLSAAKEFIIAHITALDPGNGLYAPFMRKGLGSTETGRWVWNPVVLAEHQMDELSFIHTVLKRSHRPG